MEEEDAEVKSSASGGNKKKGARSVGRGVSKQRAKKNEPKAKVPKKDPELIEEAPPRIKEKSGSS